MDKIKDFEVKIDSIKNAVDTLILIELCKLGATRDQARKVLGGVSNETYAKINTLFNKPKKK